MDLKIRDLHIQFENVAMELGIDKIEALFEVFLGHMCTFLLKK